jgi:branched-chain amino acid transport system permease protein
MIETIIYGCTIGAILYLFSIGLSLTFGAMHIINFAHGMIYAFGVYLFISLWSTLHLFIPGLILAVLAMAPVAWIIERFIIRRLYGASLDYAMIATYALLLIGTDLIKLIWGGTPYPVSDPLAITLNFFQITIPLYRLIIVIMAIVLFLALRAFFNRSLVGRIVTAALEDPEGVRCLGLDIYRYFSIVFVMGSCLAVLGGVLYAPVSTAEPYMGFRILLIAFSVVIVGGMGNFTGTFVASFVLGLVIAITGRYYSAAAETMVFVIMALVLLKDSIFHGTRKMLRMRTA